MRNRMSGSGDRSPWGTRAAEELERLAVLRHHGMLSEREFRTHSRHLVQKVVPPRSGHPVLTVAIAGVVLLMTAVSVGLHSASRPVPTVNIHEASATVSQQGQAVSYAEGYVGHNAYNGWCLRFVADAWQSAGVHLAGSSTALTYWTTNPNHWQEHPSPGSYNGAPKGALLFWGATQWNGYGHVAIAADSSGNVISSSAFPYYNGIRSDPRVFKFTITSRPSSTYHYLGWMMPGDAAGQAPTPTPSPAPAPAPAPPSTPSTGPTPNPPVTTPTTPGGGRTESAPGASSGSGTGQGPATTSAPPAPSPSPVNQPTAPAPAPTPTPPSPTFLETPGGVAHTWTNYSNAGGFEGPAMPGWTAVQIACKTPGFRVADGNTWWYRIASSPWSGGYYVSADAFYNNGATSGSHPGTPFVDPAVPDC
jgi:hypothetical protein